MKRILIWFFSVAGQSSCNSGDWSGSERDIAVPKKRRRRLFNNDPGVQDEEGDEEFLLPPVTSRSSSLLQFEQLEKQCETNPVFRASASSEQFVHSPSLTSSFSFDSLETTRWRYSGSPDSLNEASSLSSSCSSSSEIISSDDDNITRSFSSRSGPESFKSSLKSHRSFDSLVMCQEKEPREGLSGEFSQSLNNTVIIVEDPEPVTPPRGLYKTVECLTESVYEEPEKPEIVPEKKSEKVRGQRSAENLSEDSGFGEHIPRAGSLRRASSSGVFTIAENDNDDDSSSFGSSDNPPKIDDAGREGWDDVETKFNPSWQSAPDLLKLPETSQCGDSEPKGSTEIVDKVTLTSVPPITSTTSLVTFTIKDDDEFLIIPESKTFKPAEMNSRAPVVSTPNLFSESESKEYELQFPPNIPSPYNNEQFLTRAISLKNTSTSASNPNLRKARSRGSNIQITTSFINLTDSKSSIGSRGVHFSPVVSEVSWRDSDRDDWSDEEVDLDTKEGEEKWNEREESEEKEEVKREVKKDRKKEGLERPYQPPPPPPPKRPADLAGPLESGGGGREPVVVNGVPMEPHPKSKTGFGGFFQRFSLRRLSGRDKKKKDLKKDVGAKLAAHQPPTLAPKPDDVVIIPLHPPKTEAPRAKPEPQAVKLEPQEPPAPSRPQDRMRGNPPPPPPRVDSVMSNGSRVGLLETDLDSPETSPSTKKARSLLNLGGPARAQLQPCTSATDNSAENRAKSMEFLLDKENQYAAKVRS